MKLANQVLQRGCRLAFMSLVVLSGIFVVLLGSQPAQAATQTITLPVITCSSTGQLCNTLYSTTVNVPDGGPITVNFTASPGHCSSIQVLVLLDGVQFATSAFLGPGQSSGPLTTPTSVSVGTHTIAIQAQGEKGGCNVGTLGTWTGMLTVAVVTDQCAGALPFSNAKGPVTGCGVVINVTSVDSTGNATAFTVIRTNPDGNPPDNNNPFDIGDDTLVGIMNNDPNNPLLHIPISSNNFSLGFDGDGICTFSSNDCFDGATAATCSTTKVNQCYEGPNNTFTVKDANNGSIDFKTALAPNGGNTWLSLEGTPSSLTPPTMQTVITPPTDFSNTTSDTTVSNTFNGNFGQHVEADAIFPPGLNFPTGTDPKTMKFQETNRFVSDCKPYTIGTPFATCIPFDHAGNDAVSGTLGNGAKYEIICSDSSGNFAEANCPTPTNGTHIRFKDIFDLPKDSNGNPKQPVINFGTTVSAIHWYPNLGATDNLGGTNSTSWTTSSTSPHPDCTKVIMPGFACDFEDALINLSGDPTGYTSDSKKGDYLLVYNIPEPCSAWKVNNTYVNTPCMQGNSVFFAKSPLTFDFVANPAKCPAAQVCGNGWIAAPVNDVFYTFDPLSNAPDLPSATDFEDTFKCPGTGCPVPNGVDCQSGSANCPPTNGTPAASSTANVEFTSKPTSATEGQYLLQVAARDTVKITERNIQILTAGCPNPFNLNPAPTPPCYSTKLFNAQITVDNTPPTVTNLVLTPNTQIPGKTITASYTCADNGNSTAALNSGLASCGTNLNLNNGTEPGPLGPLQLSDTPFTVPQANGPQAYKVTATDVAGNTFTATANYFAGYQFFGFFAPLTDPNPSNTVGPFNPPILVNTIKAKQAVPIKWQVLDGNGVGVTGLTLASAGGTVVVNAYMSGVCTNPNSVDTTQINVTDVGSGLQDLGGGNYQLNGKSFPTGCIDLVVNPGDGTQHHAYLLSK